MIDEKYIEHLEHQLKYYKMLVCEDEELTGSLRAQNDDLRFRIRLMYEMLMCCGFSRESLKFFLL